MAAPKLRFEKYNEVWNSYKLIDIAKIYDGTHQTPNYVEQGVPFYSVEHVTANDFSNTKFIAEEVYQSELKRVSLQKGDILMTRIGDIGTSRLIDWDVRASFYVSLALIKVTGKNNSVFINQYIKSRQFQKELHDRTIHVAFPKKINLGEIGLCKIQLPEIEEQTKIASFLSAIDEKISQLTQKHELLSQYKQGMMQKLFSQQIRFKADDGSEFGEWEDGSLGDITAIQGGYAFKSNSFGKGATKVLRIGDIRNNIFLDCFDGVNSDEIPDARYLVSNDAIVMALSGATFGKLGKVKIGSAYINQRVATFKVNEKTTNEYVYQIMLSKDFFNYIQSIPSASAQPNISNQDVLNFEMLIPCLEEQTKIANFLSAIDQKINMVAQQIEQTKLWKKGLLQQMFV